MSSEASAGAPVLLPTSYSQQALNSGGAGHTSPSSAAAAAGATASVAAAANSQSGKAGFTSPTSWNRPSLVSSKIEEEEDDRHFETSAAATNTAEKNCKQPPPPPPKQQQQPETTRSEENDQDLDQNCIAQPTPLLRGSAVAAPKTNKDSPKPELSVNGSSKSGNTSLQAPLTTTTTNTITDKPSATLVTETETVSEFHTPTRRVFKSTAV